MFDIPIPSITRRDLLSTAAASITASKLAGSTFPSLLTANETDPVLPLWKKWFETHKHCSELCRLQQGLETRLFEIVRDLADDARDEAWSAADEALGYSRACLAEAEIMDEEQSLVRTLWDTPARSLVGIIAKLHSVVECEDPGDTLKITPWPELRSILADMVQLNEIDRAM